MSISSHVLAPVVGVGLAVAAVFGAPKVVENFVENLPSDTVIIVCDRNEAFLQAPDASTMQLLDCISGRGLDWLLTE